MRSPFNPNYIIKVGINTNLRASDLLRLRVYRVRDLEPGDSIEINEKKTSKSRRLTMNQACVQATRNLFEKKSYHPGEHLFKSKKSGEALKVSSVHNLVKAWCNGRESMQLGEVISAEELKEEIESW